MKKSIVIFITAVCLLITGCGDTGSLSKLPSSSFHEDKQKLTILHINAEKKGFQEFIRQAEEKLNMKNGLNFAKKVLVTGECNVLILDEVLGLIDAGVISSEELEAVLKAKMDETEVIMTGRVLEESIRSYADEIYKITAEK